MVILWSLSVECLLAVPYLPTGYQRVRCFLALNLGFPTVRTRRTGSGWLWRCARLSYRRGFCYSMVSFVQYKLCPSRALYLLLKDRALNIDRFRVGSQFSCSIAMYSCNSLFGSAPTNHMDVIWGGPPWGDA